MVVYKRAWERLVDELQALTLQGVNNIHPVVVLSYMAFIYDAEMQKPEKE